MSTPVLFPKVREAQVFPRVSWQQFEDIDRAFESIPGVKFRYLDGALEIMPISDDHEDFKTILRMLLEAYMRAKRIRFYGRGGPSLGDKTLGVRSEPDESYNLETRKPYPDLGALLPTLPMDIFCRYATYPDQFDAVDEFLREIG